MKAINLTRSWLVNTIIKLNFCPFAKIPFEKGLIRIANSKMILPLKMFDFFIDELAHMELNLNTDLSTSLLVYSNTPMNFLEFNDFSSLCDDYLELANLTSDFQIVVFHPKFYFKDSKPNNPTNSVGQSPYPTLHILRNAEVEIAINNYPNIHLVSERNSKKILSMQS